MENLQLVQFIIFGFFGIFVGGGGIIFWSIAILSNKESANASKFFMYFLTALAVFINALIIVILGGPKE